MGPGTPNLLGPLKCHDTGGGTRCHKILKIDQNIVILVAQGTILLGDQNFRTLAAFLPTHVHDRSVLLFIVLDQRRVLQTLSFKYIPDAIFTAAHTSK